MRTQRLVRLGLAFLLTVAMMALSGGMGISARPDAGGPAQSMADSSYVPAASGPIIVDHTVVDQYDNIPQEYIGQVKKMWLNVPGESHSSGYRNGLQLLEDLDSRFQVNITESGAPEAYTDQYLRVSRALRTQYNSWAYGTGEQVWYTNITGTIQIKNHLTYANTHDLTIAAFGFGWCWDMTWHNSPGGTIDPVYQVRWAGSSVSGPDGDMRWGLDAGDVALTGNTVTMDTYLDVTQEYMDYAQTNGYPTRVFFTTGPVDGYSGESGYQRQLKHEYIRNYVRASSDRILFDYADILSWSNAGQQNLQSWTDYGGVSKQYQMIHADNMLDLDGTYTEDGDHIGQRGALRLGKALWWMLARLAGWDGQSTGTPTVTLTPINTSTSTATLTATATKTATLTPTATATQAETQSVTPTATQTPRPTRTPGPSVTPWPDPSAFIYMPAVFSDQDLAR